MCTVNDASLGVVCIFGFMLKLLNVQHLHTYILYLLIHNYNNNVSAC